MNKPKQMLLLKEAWPLAQKIAEYLRQHEKAEQVEVAGSIRRHMETVSEIEVVIASREAEDVLAFAQTMPGVTKRLHCNSHSCSVALNININLNIYIATPEDFSAALYFYSGSQKHIEQIRALAKEKGFTFSEKGLYTDSGKQQIVSEKQLLSYLGLAYLEPELREGRGELERAANNLLPTLVTAADIKGGIHIHTSSSDGQATIAELAAKAQEIGWNYLGISDHSQSAHYAGGLKTQQVLEQRCEIDKLNNKNPNFRILAGIESDIRLDGSLDYSDDILSQFDFVIASVHSGFKQDEQTMTKRIIKAMSNRFVSVLGHATGRILLKRPGYKVNLPEIINAAAQTGTTIEINSNPRRLDLDWRWHSYAQQKGVLFAINPDAHAVNELSYMEAGLAVARKGGLSSADIINTRNTKEIEIALRKKR
ncbi:DNA polymerase/3'-5' exonuclease PolX [Dendrosporobacter sp. 1207_IL3150]|uniref:DNA polymerase/3'-5' exonuclease PolX n=1 Tax=Dendrosporobacter sp. 1207_IL3150 TaxID=3084054 RepID=UPI002FDB65B8